MGAHVNLNFWKRQEPTVPFELPEPSGCPTRGAYLRCREGGKHEVGYLQGDLLYCAKCGRPFERFYTEGSGGRASRVRNSSYA